MVDILESAVFKWQRITPRSARDSAPGFRWSFFCQCFYIFKMSLSSLVYNKKFIFYIFHNMFIDIDKGLA